MQVRTDYETSKTIPPKEGPLQNGGGPHKEGTVPGHEPPIEKTQKAAGQAKSGILGSMYPHVTRGMAPGGGKGPPPPGGGGLPADKLIDEEDEEDEEGDTDEETISVTSSSQDSADKIRYQRWRDTGPVHGSGAGGPPEDPNNPLGEGVVKKAAGDLEAIGVKGEELDPQGRMVSLGLCNAMQFQQNVNRNMVEHLNMTVKNQELQGKALGQLVENTRQ